MNNYGETFGKCEYCGADKVKSPKTGKIFCSEKCWLKQAKPYTPSQAKNEAIRGFQEKKEESMKFMAIRRAAVETNIAEMGQTVLTKEQIKENLEHWKEYFTNFYEDVPF